jgi:hypothetical protein
MASYIQGENKTFKANEDVTMYRLAALEPSSTDTPFGVNYCQPHQKPIGVFFKDTSSGYDVSVRMFQQYSSYAVYAGAAISKGAKVYPGLDGKVYPYGVQGAIGIAQAAASAAGSIIEILYNPIDADEDEDLQVARYDFTHYIDSDQWTAINNDGGSVAIGDGYPGAMAITATTTDNDQTWVKGTAEHYKFVNNKPLYMKAVVKLTESNTDDANVFVGMANAVADDHLQDNGAGPPASSSHICFFKVDGGTVWQAEISDAAEQDTDTSAGSFTSGSWHKLEFWFWPTGSATAEANFYVDDTLGAELVVDGGTNGLTDYASATDMQLALGVKCGGGNPEVLYARLVEAVQYVG